MVETNDSNETPDPRIVCFEDREAEKAFDRSISKLMGALQEQSRAMFMNEHNVLRMNHGAKWVHSAREDEPDTAMHHISAEWVIPYKDIADNDLNLIARTVRPINEAMQRQFAQNIYAMVGSGAQKVGNVVDGQATGSFALSMLEMFRKIEFGVDRDGSVSLPQIHLNPETFKRVEEELRSIPPDIEAQIEEVKALKIQAALQKEAERKAKFKQGQP